MTVHMDHDDDNVADNPSKTDPMKRLRWATQRKQGAEGLKKRQSIFRRLSRRGAQGAEKNRNSTGSELSTAAVLPQAQAEALEETGPSRRVFFNVPLPDDARDAEGAPIAHYPRNKIRTAKYTPLSFVPKNLWFQFHNIANIYFFFIIILGIFAIFGVNDPGLSAVPLIVIVTLTAIKDAIEDWRRTVVDNELNNAPIHRLINWSNVNTAEDKISPWRRFKKANTRAVTSVWRAYKTSKTRKEEKGKAAAERALDNEPTDARNASITSENLARQETRDLNGAMEMTPVQGHGFDHRDRYAIPPPADYSVQKSGDARLLEVPQEKDGHGNQFKRFYGSLLDPYKSSAGKARFKKDQWKNVQVGDYVRLYDEEEIPADIVILSTSDDDGACYVETKNLDGETNLKVRQALHCGVDIKRARDCEKSEFTIDSEAPHANLYSYSGAVRWQQRDPKDPHAPLSNMAEPISINNMLLRGCTIRNTEWVLGVVLFTGEDTKIMLNSGLTPSKRAQISKDLNWNVIYNFIILFFMCFVAGVVEGTTWAKGNESLNFFEFGSYGGSPSVDGFVTFWAALILFQNLVPISLYISLEIIRTAQAFFIYSDVYMYYEKLDYPCTPKSWNISDDLGQIEYIFSDKTGTLTQNVMEFKKVTINGVPYGEAYTEAMAGLQKRQGIDTDEVGAKARAQIAVDRVRMLDLIRKTHDNPYLLDNELTFVAPDFIADLAGASGPAQMAANENFMLVLALCHTVLTERIPGDPPRIEFKAQSPDEAALVATARDCGFTVLGRNNEGLVVNVMGHERTYTVLNILEFNSSRKRMSAIIRMPNGKIMLYCKGADSVIYSRLKAGEQPELRKATAEQLETFAREGLRTLCVAQRELDEREYETWNKQHDIAAASIQDREDRLEEVSDAIERELTLIGGTAIEDRLQDGVPDAISLLAQAGIKLWVLTGDKVETAINIGFSCNLLDTEMEILMVQVDSDNVDEAEAEIDKHLATFGKTGSDEELKVARLNHEAPAPTHALVIDGDTLRLVLDERVKQKFLLLCKECKSVLCCRVSPAQKAAVVNMVKYGLDVMTLSIGDGANDVAMIQEAHVGVGIAGEEGRQAVMSSDYAIGQFRFLTRLVLVHGRWSYRRLSETIANFFYKNIVWTFALFWFQIYDNFDCSYIFNYTYILLYNLAFTSLSVIFMGILDQDVDDKVSLAVPQLYRRGIERKEWTQLKFWIYMVDGVYQSAICYFMAYLIFSPATFATESGRDINDYQRIGVFMAHGTVVVVNLYILLNTYRWDWFMVMINTISWLLIWLWTGAYTSFTDGFTFYGAAAECYGAVTFWMTTLLIIIICLMPRFLAKAIQKIYFPRDIDIVREQVNQGRFDYLKDIDPGDNSAIMSTKKHVDSTSSSEISNPTNPHKLSTNPVNNHKQRHSDDDQRPFYPPSTHNPRSQADSDGTDSTQHTSMTRQTSVERAFPIPVTQTSSRYSLDNATPYRMPSYRGTASQLQRVQQQQEQQIQNPFEVAGRSY